MEESRLLVKLNMKHRVHEYSKPDAVHIWVGTFNLNGRGGGVKEDLTAWLRPGVNQRQEHPGIVAVGFQEIVELSPQQIMSADPVRRQAWEIAVKRSLNESARTKDAEEYVLLRSGQLVGAALMIFVRLNLLGKIKNVEGSVKKVGNEQCQFGPRLTSRRLVCRVWRATKGLWPFVWTTLILGCVL